MLSTSDWYKYGMAKHLADDMLYGRLVAGAILAYQARDTYRQSRGIPSIFD